MRIVRTQNVQIESLHTGSDMSLQQKQRNTNLRKSFDSSLHRGKSGLTCYKYSIKTAEQQVGEKPCDTDTGNE